MSAEVISHYRLGRELGSGGMGVVYEAEDLHLGRKVALKFLPPNLTDDRTALERLQREARAASALNHPNICTIYDIDRDGGRHFIAMERLEGQTLAEKTAGTPLPIDELLDLGVQIADALAAAHAKGIIHRDLKPSNIFIADSGQAKLLDFGLAKILPEACTSARADDETALTNAGQIPGTLLFMSPEQVLGKPLDARTDLFSFGVVLYNMATGKLPFRGDTSGAIAHSILGQTPTPPVVLNPQAPPKLEEIINKALEKKRELRYQTASDLRADLQRIKRDSDSVALPALGTVSGVSRRMQRDVIDSVAVLPFANSGGEVDTEYLSDGISENVIDNLTQLRGLRVMARSTVFRYKGTDQDPQRIGRELRVRAVLLGRLLQRGNNLMVQTELVDVKEGTRLWGAQYNRPIAEVLALQAEISREISQNLRLRLTGEEQQRLTKRYTDSAEAYQLYLKGRYFWNKRTEVDLRKAISYFQQAIVEDPAYALAYVGLADSYHVLWVYTNISPKECHEHAKAAALQAVQIDDSLAEAHTTLASIAAADDWDFPAAESEFQKALAINPNYANAHRWYAESLTYVGRFDEALVEIRKAQELDPLSLVGNMAAGQILILARKYDKAITELRNVIELDKNFPLAHSALRDAYEYKHMFMEAIAENEAAAVAQGYPGEEAQEAATMLRQAYVKGGEAAYWRARVRLAHQHMQEGRVINYDESRYRIASFHAHLGDVDSVLPLLEELLEQRDIALAFVNTAPEFQALRSDPRLVKILDQMGLHR